MVLEVVKGLVWCILMHKEGAVNCWLARDFTIGGRRFVILYDKVFVSW